MKWRWKLPEVLRREGITAYRLWRESGVAHATAYRWGRSERPPTALDLDTLGAVLDTLRRLTKKPYSLQDLLEAVEDEEDGESQ